MRASSFKIRFKRNSQFEEENFFIREDENKIRMLGGAEIGRGYCRTRRKQAVRKVSKDLSGMIQSIQSPEQVQDV